MEPDKLILKFLWKFKSLRITKLILKKKNVRSYQRKIFMMKLS